MHVVGADELYVMLAGKSDQFRVDFLLNLEDVARRVSHFGRMALEFDIVVVAENAFPPCHLFVGLIDASCLDETRNLAAETRRSDDQSFAVGLEFMFVRARMGIETLRPGFRHEFYQILVAGLVLCQHNEMAPLVVTVNDFRQAFLGHVHLAADYETEVLVLYAVDPAFDPLGFRRVAALFGFFKLFLVALQATAVDIIIYLFHTEHIAVVCNGHSGHAVGQRLVNERRHR